MSWLARSLANSLRPDHRDDGGDQEYGGAVDERPRDAEGRIDGSASWMTEPATPSRGVKEDLSELTQTLTRQFWGVASFLAPPPPPPIPSAANSYPSAGSRRPDPDQAEAPDPPGIAGIRSDFAEIGGRFRTGISRLSNNAAVTELSKIASNFLPFGSEEAEEEDEEEEEEEESGWTLGAGAIGITDEVLTFARNISMHPETWLDFPLFNDFEDCGDFDMSDAQQEHAFAVERLAPRLAALRIELCPSHVSEGCFWKIYFVLLHSRLNKHDAELLSTPQIAETRAMLLQRLQSRTKPESEIATKGASYRNVDDISITPGEQVTTSNILYGTNPATTRGFEEARTSIPLTDFEMEKHTILTARVKIIDKSVIGEEPSIHLKDKEYEGDEDDWLEEDMGEMGVTRATAITLVNEEDVSFSDLEDDDDDDCSIPTCSKIVIPTVAAQTKDTHTSS